MSTPCPPNSPSSGSPPYLIPALRRSSRLVSSGSKDSLSEVPKAPKKDICTGSSYSTFKGRVLSPPVVRFSDRIITSLLDLKQPKNMSGKKRPASPGPSLCSENDPSVEHPQIGRRYGIVPATGECLIYQRTYGYAIILPCDGLLLTIAVLVQENVKLFCSGAPHTLERVIGRGWKQPWMLFLKVQPLNGGADMQVRKMLSSMNLEEKLESPTCCDGLTNIRYVWRPKVDKCRCEPLGSGLLQTCLWEAGIRSLIL